MSTSGTASPEVPQYEEFYGFLQSPFTLAPDPRFLYRSPSHEDAIRRLLLAIDQRAGMAVLSGDIGTGKTTVCRAVLERLDATRFTSLVLNPFLSVDELLREILLDFGVVSREAVRTGRVSAAGRQALAGALRDFLASLVPLGGSGVLIIDEAQHLSPQVLEELHVLSDLRADGARLLQVVLVGQLSLLDLLEQAEQRHLDHTVVLTVVLQPLTRPDVDAYVGHRLGVGGGASPVTFDGPALDAVHASTLGVPRLINLLCDRTLMVGASRGLYTMTADLVADAARSLGLDIRPTNRRWWTRIIFAWTRGAA